MQYLKLYNSFHPFLFPAMLVFIGIPTLWFFSSFIQRQLEKLAPANLSLLLARIMWYAGLIVIALTTLGDLGYNVSTLIGTAGIIGVTIGFASQTSISNIISGIFLICENVFKIGDTLTVTAGGMTTGTVERINLFSITLKTADNKLVRVPNEFMLKNPVIIAPKTKN